MKILHVNTYDGNGGAGRACLRLNKALNAAGADSKVLTMYKFGDEPDTLTISNSWFSKARSVYRIFAERYWSKWVTKSLKTPFSVQWFGLSIVENKYLKDADIIHLHWINHGFLTPKFIAELEALDKPVVWTFHDSNAFTGGCHVRYGCEHYFRSCGECPLLKISGPNDLSHRIWKRKKNAYSTLACSIVAPSAWMADSVKLSSLLGTRDISVIPNTLETDIFKPYVKAEAKTMLKLKPSRFVMMSGFMPSKNDKHKGTEYLIDALQILSERRGIDIENLELVVFGNKPTQQEPDKFPVRTTWLGTISKDEHLAKCYSAADVFILPSLEDNLPNTVMESLACGTPVVAFRTGGIPDMVNHMENGYLAEYRSAEDLADGIEWLYSHHNAAQIQQEARKTVLSKFSEKAIADAHIELYERLTVT